MMDRALELLGKLPTTNARIAITIALTVLTALVVLACFVRGRELQEGALALWLAYLATSSGLDVRQFTNKRKTFRPMDVDEAAVTERPEA